MRAAILFFAAAFSMPAIAQAVPVTGGTTVVRVLAPLGDIVPGVLGSATVRSADPLDLLFPITGGDVTPFTGTFDAVGQLFHEGSGFSLTLGADVAEIRNLIVNATDTELTVLGDVTLNGVSLGDDLELFYALPGVSVLLPISDPVLQLNLTQTAVDLLEDVFGIDDIDIDQRFGTVATAPEFAAAVPAPAALALFGLGALALAGRCLRA